MRRLTQDFVHAFLKPDEGELHQIYGKVKNGKTLYATKLAWEDLMRGQSVIANWQIYWNGYDEREHWWPLLKHALHLKKALIKIPKDNFIYLDPTKPAEEITARIARTTDAVLYLDEGHRYFDSYLKTTMSMHTREIALLTAHFDRTIKIITQRPSAIHVSLRGNVNRFFKIQKEIPFFGLFGPKFYVTEIQDMKQENPDEENPEKQESFWGSKRWYNRYNYKSMRGDVPRSQPNYAEAYVMTLPDIVRAFFTRKKKEITADQQIPKDLTAPKIERTMSI